MPDGPQKRIATKRFFMRLAAIYATQDGYIIHLAKMIEVHPKTLISQMSTRVPVSDCTMKGLLRVLRPAELPELKEIYKSNH